MTPWLIGAQVAAAVWTVGSLGLLVLAAAWPALAAAVETARVWLSTLTRRGRHRMRRRGAQNSMTADTGWFGEIEGVR